ncbi:MAG: PEP-CTERM sorting domain-containing protein [Burkholderiales bacterium]
MGNTCRRSAGIALLLLATGAGAGGASAASFVPAHPLDTDSAYLIDNYAVLLDGVPTDANADFEAGSLAGFLNAGSGETVIDALGSLRPADGSGHFAFASTGPGSAPGGMFEHQNIIVPVSVSAPVTAARVKADLVVLTNQDPPTASDPDWVHLLLWYRPDAGDAIQGPTLLYRRIPDFAFDAAPADTGFRWMTGVAHLDFDITAAVNGAFAAGVHQLEVHAVVAETLPSPVPEPATWLLSAVGLGALIRHRRRQLRSGLATEQR